MAEQIPMPNEAEVPDAVLRHNAEWESTFSPSIPSTSLARRGRARETIDAYATRLQERQMQARDQQLAQDKGAQALWFKQQQLGRLAERDQAELAANHLKAEAANELQGYKIENIKAQTAANIARAKAAETTSLLKSRVEARTAEATAGFAEHVAQLVDSGITEGSPEFAQGFTRGLVSFPGAEKGFVREIAGRAKIKEDPDTLLQQINTLPPELRRNISTRANADGTWSMTTNPTPELTPNARMSGLGGELGRMNSEIKSLDKQLAETTDEAALSQLRFRRDQITSEITSTRDQLQGLLAPPTQTQPQVAPADAAPAPAQPTAPQTAPAPQGGVLTKEAYDALPPGAEFVHNGRKGIKPKPTAATP